MEQLFVQLNPSQLEAVTSTEGFIRVIAGAGSGKTRALSYRFAFLVNEIGILPGNILCVTFTNKSANEMRQRIHKLTGDNEVSPSSLTQFYNKKKHYIYYIKGPEKISLILFTLN